MEGTGVAELPPGELLIRRKALRRALSGRPDLRPLKIAVLCGSTANEVVDLLELSLLESGFRPEFHISGFGRFYEDAVLDSGMLEAFRPDVTYLHTSVENLRTIPGVGATESEFAECVQEELGRFREVWTALERKLGCVVIQNNFEFPALGRLGNLDASAAGGLTRFVAEMNREFAREAAERPQLLMQDVCSMAARVGLGRWFDRERWFAYGMVTTPEGSHGLAVSLAALVRAVYGRTRKVLVLDLDETLWGGVVGEDGVERLRMGRGSAGGEAFGAFQEYCLRLRERGVVLAVCSKNEEAEARRGFAHPESVLNCEHFAAFRANWLPKHENLVSIAEELGLGLDSFVFVDDNPAERALVRAQLPEVAVPEVGGDVARFPEVLEAQRYFEPAGLTAEDLRRAGEYESRARRVEAQAKFADYGEYLDSLEMEAEIGVWNPMGAERVAQLINKTNQFNLTGRRYTLGEVQELMEDGCALGLYGRLKDRFGDNGLITAALGVCEGEVLTIRLWVMSCRVLKREMELAMLDALAEQAQARGLRALRGEYVPSRKNALVADHYERLGFARVGEEAGAVVYRLELEGYAGRNRHVRVRPGR